RNRTVAGAVTLPDGTPLGNARVVATSSLGGQTSVNADATGHYTLSVAPGTYTFDVAFNFGGFGTQGTTVASGVTVSQDQARDLTVQTIHLNGRVVDDQGAVAPGVVFHANGFAGNTCCGGFQSFNATTDASGRFSVQIVPGQYYQVSMTPP